LPTLFESSSLTNYTGSDEFFYSLNDGVEKVSSYSNRAVNQIDYQIEVLQLAERHFKIPYYQPGSRCWKQGTATHCWLSHNWIEDAQISNSTINFRQLF